MIATLAALLLIGQAPAAAPAILTIKGEAASQMLDAAALAALPRETATVTDHGKARHFSGVSAAVLLGKAGAPSGEALRGKALTTMVMASGSDGYRVAFSLAELDPGMRTAKVIVADQEDGKPLAARDGPYKLIVEGDLRPARSVRGLVGLELKRVP